MIHSSVAVLVVSMVDVFAFRAEADIAGSASEGVFALVDGLDVVSQVG